MKLPEVSISPQFCGLSDAVSLFEVGSVRLFPLPFFSSGSHTVSKNEVTRVHPPKLVLKESYRLRRVNSGAKAVELVPLRGPSRLKANPCIAGRLGEVVFVGIETASRDMAGKAEEEETREWVAPTEFVEECTSLPGIST